MYGFRCENNELIIVPQEASIVKEIFRLYLEGKTVRQIKISLEEKEVLSSSGKTTWADTTIQQILKCENIKEMLCFKKLILKII
ncbi:recombinase family protein [Lacrimispora indolis]|uniref:recombinase family protein n=1 Tax=Lacrimispora indolis TaxID=69825 RepID=UPI002E8E226C|nr:recombinase family protein [Lacrimispora indolis]